MKFYRSRFYLFCILTICIWNEVYSQTKDLTLQEDKFVNSYSKLYNLDRGNDSIAYYSERFGKAFTSFIKANPSTLTYPFKKLTERHYCQVTTSYDGNFRVYSWDTQTGGTMHYFNQIYQYRTNEKVFIKIPNYGKDDAGVFCSKIYAVTIKNKVYYLAISNGIYSSKNASQSISAFTIDNNKLVDTVKLFRTKTKLLNSIDVNFDFFNVVDRPERLLELITYDDKHKIIYISVVNNKGQVTAKKILYQLKGSYFEFIGIETAQRK